MGMAGAGALALGGINANAAAKRKKSVKFVKSMTLLSRYWFFED